MFVSNGTVNKEPAKELVSAMDAANIDLKSFNAEFYKKELKGSLETVKDFISSAYDRLSLEVTTLIIPGRNDSEDEMESIAIFLSSLSRDIPLHISCYYPAGSYTVQPTDPGKVFSLAKIAKKHLNYVYPGNVGFARIDTVCPNCKKVIVSRRGYTVNTSGIKNSRCVSCGTPVPVTGL